MTPVAGTEDRLKIEPERSTVFFLPISHLDTQWRWTVRETIRSFLPKTLAEHRDRFARFPSYCVNFDGAFRYALIEEYDPEGFDELRGWIDDGRWKVSGAFWDAADVNIPSPESLIRQCLYGKLYFRQRFGQDPADIFLPDCFGFGAQLPIVAAHCGLVGFSSSKLRRDDWMRSAIGIPFPIGVWEGKDGSEIVCALDPGGYGEKLTRTPADDAEILDQVERQRRLSGQALAVRYFGLGDKGGAPGPESLEVLEQAVAERATVTTKAVGSSELFRRLHRDRANLPRHRGDLLLTTHGPGCYTSHAAMKRGNQANEFLGEAAEKAASAAHWLGGLPYPTEALREAWQRLLWHQFHDDLTGTSIPEAYDISWNDLGIVANQFAEVLRHAVGTVARALDTETEGLPLVVFNPLSQPRTDIVEAPLAAAADWRAVRVHGPDGRRCPAQLEPTETGGTQVVFVAELPPLGFAVFDVCAIDDSPDGPSDGLGLREQDNGIYRIRLDDRGDLAEVYDHRLGRDLLAGPTRLQLLTNRSTRFPAWEIQYEDVARAPMAKVRAPSTTTLRARGEARVVVETRRRAKGSTFVQRLRLAHGEAGDRIEVENRIDWRTRGTLLKAAFPLAAAAPTALYDRGVTTVEHGINHPKLYEVPAQQWALQRTHDATAGHDWGTAVLSRAKYGWDKPDAETLRLTLLHTPEVGRRFRHQALLDIGQQRMEWALYGFSGRALPRVPWAAARFNQPPLPFLAPRGPGPLGRSWSFLKTAGDQALVRTVKRSEEGDEFIVRLSEVAGQTGKTTLRLGRPIESVRSLDGCEQPLDGAPPVATGEQIEIQLQPSRPVTLGLHLAPPEEALEKPRSRPLPLPHDWAVVSRSGEKCQDGLADGICFPGELWPRDLRLHGIRFELAAPGVHHQQVVRCRGQRIQLDPPGFPADQLHLLLCAVGDDRRATFGIGEDELELVVPSATGLRYAWDRVHHHRARWLRQLRVDPGFLHPEPIAWVASHTHDKRGRDRPYHLAYLFHTVLPFQGGALNLPDDGGILLVAASLVHDPNGTVLDLGSGFDGNLLPTSTALE